MENQQSRERITDLYTQLLEAWNRRDADGFAALFAENGSCVGFDGSQMNGRAEIAEQLRTVFKDHPTAAYVAKVREVRFVDQQSALLRAVVGMIPPGQRELKPATNAVQSLLVNGTRIALLQNTPAAFHGRPSLVTALTQELTDVYRRGVTVEH